MKTLGAITLPTGLHWLDQYASLGTAGVVRTALNGAAVVFGPSPQPRKIALSAGDDHGWFTPEQADALIVLAATPGPHVLHWQGTEFQVAFDHSQGAAVNLTPLYPNAPYLTGTISLIEV